MSAAQVARDLRYVASDLGCALLQVSVSGVAAVGSWVGRRRQVVLSDRAQAVLDADRLAEAEQDREVWEPHAKFPDCCTFHEPAHFDAADELTSLTEEMGLYDGPVHPADAKHHGGHQLHLDGSLTALPVRSLAGMAGDGPEDVTASSGQPTGASVRLDWIANIVNVHWWDWTLDRYFCMAPGCNKDFSTELEHAAHVAELIDVAITADTRINNALNRNQR